jgi:hypothetical protein
MLRVMGSPFLLLLETSASNGGWQFIFQHSWKMPGTLDVNINLNKQRVNVGVK